jgi:hypothetical protein
MHPHPPPHPSLAQFLRQLAREEALLRDALANVVEVNEALRRGDAAAALVASERPESIAAAQREAAEARAASAAALARELRLDGESLTLSRIAANLPEVQAAEVLTARDRLAAVARELAAVQTRNANLLEHLRSFYRGVLSGVTGLDAPRRYGPSGGPLDPSAGGAIRTQG